MPSSLRALCRALPALALLALAGGAHAQGCVEPPQDVVAWWPGDGVAELESGMDAKLVAGATHATGLVGEAFDVDGPLGQRVLLSRLAADGLADLSLELWVKTATGGGILSGANGDDPTGNELLLFATPAQLSTYVKAQRAPIDVVLADDAWHHVALVREATQVRTYVDGALVDESAFPAGSLAIGPRGLMLGQEQDCLGGCFEASQALDGLVDEVTLYGRALAGDEIAAIHGAGAAGKCKPVSGPPLDGDLVLRIEDLEGSLDAAFEELDAARVRIDELEAEAHVHGHRGPCRRRHRHRHRD